MIHAAAQLAAQEWRKTCKGQRIHQKVQPVPAVWFLRSHWDHELHPHERAEIGDIEDFREQVIQALRRRG